MRADLIVQKPKVASHSLGPQAQQKRQNKSAPSQSIPYPRGGGGPSSVGSSQMFNNIHQHLLQTNNSRVGRYHNSKDRQKVLALHHLSGALPKSNVNSLSIPNNNTGSIEESGQIAAHFQDAEALMKQYNVSDLISDT